MVAMAIMVASFRDLAGRLARAGAAGRPVSARRQPAATPLTSRPTKQARIAALPGVRRAEFLREQQLLLDPRSPRVVLQARAIDAANPARACRWSARHRRARGRAAAGVGERGHGRSLWHFVRARVIELPLAGKAGASPSPASGATTRGSRAPSSSSATRYVALTGDRAVTNGALWLAAGADRADGRGRASPRYPGRRPARHRGARRNPRGIAQDVRSHVRGDLCARARGGRHRAGRTVLVVRRAGARAAARVRHAAPHRHDAPAGRRHARDRRRSW